MKNERKEINRRDFIRMTSLSGAGLAALPIISSPLLGKFEAVKRIGIIGLDTSHSEAFTQIINNDMADRGFRVVAAYPHGSPDIADALKMKPAITEAVQKMGVKIVTSIDSLLDQVDFVLLESNDGRVHFEQVKPVIDRGIPVFVDKPLSSDYLGAANIIKYAEQANCPLFSASALRFDENAMKVKQGEIGNVLGADIYTYAPIEPTHLDMAWYMIHGLELLYTAMGRGCKEVYRLKTEGYDKIVGLWGDGRIGSVRGIRWGVNNIAGTAFGEKGIAPLGPFNGYERLVSAILTFFETKISPIDNKETLEMFSFMDAAQKSLDQNQRISLV